MKKAFTVAELMITLGVIGVLAALVIPTLYQNFNKSLLKRTQDIQQRKISQGITMLSVRSARLSYPTTLAFVKDLQNYTQILKYCDNNHLVDCWPTGSITLTDGEEFPLYKAKDGNIFMMGKLDPEGNVAQYASDNAAFVTNNGVSVLINYNTKCNPNTNNWNRTCYVALVDGNGPKGPNKIGEDLFLINARGFVKPAPMLVRIAD